MATARNSPSTFVKTGAPTGTPGRNASIVTVAICGLISLFEGFDSQAAGVAAPGLRTAFAMTAAQLGWFFSASTFGLILGAAVGGRLSDRFGRKAVLIGSVAAFGAMSACTAASSNLASLMLFRVLTGVGLGGALPNLIALVAENASPKWKNGLLSGLYAGMPAGGALVSILGLVGGAGSWRLPFQIGGLVPLLAVPLMMLALPESRELKTVQAGAVRSGDRAGFLDALFAQGRAASTLLLCAAFFLSLLTQAVLLNWLPILLVGRGLTRPEASLVQMSFSVLNAGGGVLTGLLMGRVAMRPLVLASLVAAASSLLLLAAAPARIEVSLVVGGLVGAAMAMTQGLLYALAPMNYRAAQRGTGVGSALAIGRVGATIGPLLAGVVLAGGASPQRVLAVLIPTMTVAGLATLVLAERVAPAASAGALGAGLRRIVQGARAVTSPQRS